MKHIHIVNAVKSFIDKNGGRPINAEDLLEILTEAMSRQVHEEEAAEARDTAFWQQEGDY